MANKRISDLDTVPNVDGTEQIPVAKGGLNYKVAIAAIANFLGIANASAAGLMSSAQAQKLNGIATGATANDTDANLRSRSTHTGTQPASTITGLATVATSGVYGDLSGKPDLSLAGLGAAPASHVGASGPTAHPLATTTDAGFMSPGQVLAMNNVKNIAFSADYNDLTAHVPFTMKGGHAGFSMWTDSSTSKGATFNDYNSFGTGAYVAMAASGTTYDSATDYHSFTSTAGTYAIAGLRSANPAAKRGHSVNQGGFFYEAVVGYTFTAGQNLIVGLSANSTQGYGNWGDGDEGIAVGFNATDGTAAQIKIMTGDGTSSNRTASTVTTRTLADNHTLYVSITMKPGDTQAYVTVKDLDTGDMLFDNVAVTANLPRADTPLYAMVENGTLTTSTATVVRIHQFSCRRWPNF